ncbi:hypothetical protein [Lysinibacillus xylanilyticus]
MIWILLNYYKAIFCCNEGIKREVTCIEVMEVPMMEKWSGMEAPLQCIEI